MIRSHKTWRAAGVLAFILIAIALLLFANLGAITTYAMTPGVPFDGATPSAPPDYRLPEHWSALPGRVDLADRTPAGSDPADPGAAGVDVFYIHPTSYVGSHWNAAVDEPALNNATDRVATGIQAAAFNGCCQVYAPRYRQANGTAFYRPSPDGARAIDLAYADVRRAFDRFNALRGVGRPFILAAHSQGAVLAERLLHDAISGTPMRQQLVAAYLLGGGITAASLRERAPDIPVCSAADALHCVVAWNARALGYVPGDYDVNRADARDWVCVNPLSWRTDGAHASRESNLGAVFLETNDHAPRVGFADAQCVDGLLVVAHMDSAPRDIPSRILDHVMGSGNYHAIEYQIFFMNIRQNALVRVSAFKTRYGE